MLAMSILYLNHFGLNSPPFSIIPDPGFFFAGENRGAFIDGLLHSALQAEGIVLVIGEVGSGKTMMIRLLLARLPDNVDTVYLPNPSFSRDEIVDVIARDLGVIDQGTRLESLQHELIKRHALGRKVVVLVDEAHAMPADSIEEIRRLSNLETEDHKLVQLILCGQPELDTLLAAPSLRQVRDRVVYRFELHSLSKDDAICYLEHRLRVAGWRGGRMFSGYGERLLLNDAKGRARRLNLVADKALLAAFAEGRKQVNAKHVRLAIKDVGANFSSLKPGKPAGLFWLLIIFMVAFIWLSFDRSWISGTTRPPALLVGSKPPHITLPDNKDDKNSRTDSLNFGYTEAARLSGITHSQHAIIDPTSDDIDLRIKQSHLNAQKQAALENYAVQLVSIQNKSDAVAFITIASITLTNEQIYLRYYVSSDTTWYIVYFGNFLTRKAANRAINALAKELIKAKPVIRTWKEISNSPWYLRGNV